VVTCSLLGFRHLRSQLRVANPLCLPSRQSPAAAPTIGAQQRPSTAPLSQPASEPAPAPQMRDWIGVLAMVTGLVMAIMDVQIVTSSLTQIQGGLSATADEIAWVQTAYLIADVVMVPLSGTMSRLLSTRVLFVAAALGFTGASALCATRSSEPSANCCRPGRSREARWS